MTLRLEREGAVATLLIDRPRQHNAMNQAMWEQLPRLVQEAMADEAIRVLILSSATPGLPRQHQKCKGEGNRVYQSRMDCSDYSCGHYRPNQIGRASCRERVCQYVSIPVVAVS